MFVIVFFIIIVINIMFVCSPNFFILDEPTNHLDMETIEALGRALQKFQVSVVPRHMKLSRHLVRTVVIYCHLRRLSPTPVKLPVYSTPVISNCQLNRTRVSPTKVNFCPTLVS